MLTNFDNLRKSKSQQTSRELNKLCMTHGDPLGLKREELMKFLTDANYRSRENTFERHKVQLPHVNTHGLSWCKCAHPMHQLKKGNSFLNETSMQICLKCGGKIHVDIDPSPFLPHVIDIHYGDDRNSKKNLSYKKLINEKDDSKSEKKEKKKFKLPKIIDPNRYQKAYLRALHVAKFGGDEIPKHWNQYFNHEITPSYIFSYFTHTPQCLQTPQTCPHKKRDLHKLYTSQQIHRHIFKDVKVEDYLDPL